MASSPIVGYVVKKVKLLAFPPASGTLPLQNRRGPVATQHNLLQLFRFVGNAVPFHADARLGSGPGVARPGAGGTLAAVVPMVITYWEAPTSPGARKVVPNYTPSIPGAGEPVGNRDRAGSGRPRMKGPRDRP